MKLNRLSKKIQEPLLLVILDGVGLYKGIKEGYPGNALDLAKADFLKMLFQPGVEPKRIFTTLKAHGTAVGMPSDDDMGNSEVGHNALGAGRIFAQGASLVNQAIETGRLFQSEVWKEYIGTNEQPGYGMKGSTVHFIGLLSDGNVHSHINHLFAMIRKCKELGVKEVRVHALLDGRDVPEKSAEIYLEKLEKFLKELDPTGEHYRVASGGGRMVITMDRYEANWKMVELGWKTHVKGEAEWKFTSSLDAIQTFRKVYPDKIDQDLPPFVIVDQNQKPVGPIRDQDVVIFYNFRGDRAIEISRAFTEENFDKFVRDPEVKVHFAGMMEYDGDLKIPKKYLVPPPAIDKTVSEYLAHMGIYQYAISETQKFGHVTYFWNGNNSLKFNEELEDWVEIPSDRVPFQEKPEMKAKEITDTLIEALRSKKYQFLRVNYANGDMVGHTGVLEAAIRAVETLNEQVKRLYDVITELKGTMIVIADHGNCEQMIEVDKKTGQPLKQKNGKYATKTSHTLNPVPFVIISPYLDELELNPINGEYGLGNIASTLLVLLGFEPPEFYLPPVVRWKSL
ncbi:MAG: 2,3-bisphosphoglycerate-independent phosphoglycerate mutase [Leptospiraceae bacterium]|nr:2,3-bisphosphoglycerate-independent phosphoglycerate mutase [Leptospiraceae bacterium]MDW7976641.1 2,3-bisphosphoglycerate-independent phosphoglycerate mutase [Leptospiraceae bacterium]